MAVSKHWGEPRTSRYVRGGTDDHVVDDQADFVDGPAWVDDPGLDHPHEPSGACCESTVARPRLHGAVAAVALSEHAARARQALKLVR